mgnify:CR=1 FL=1
MKKNFNIAIVGLGQIGLYLLNELYNKKNFLELVREATEFVQQNSSSAMVWNLLALGHRYSGNVQEARKQFCECYARESQNPIYELYAYVLPLARQYRRQLKSFYLVLMCKN